MVPARTLMRLAATGALALIVATVGACRRDDGAAAARATAEARAFEAGQQAWREQRREALLQPEGWASLVGLHWIEPGAHYVGSDPDNGIRIAIGPAHLGMLELARDGALRFVPESGVAVTIDGQPLTQGTPLRSDVDPAGASRLGFDEGKGVATVIRRGDRYALRVKHADAETRTRFGRIEYWPGGPDWVVPARFVPHPPGRTMPVVNIIGITEQIPNPGAVEFQREDKTFRLEALDEGDGRLFLIYADRTSGHGSYPAGRYLYADMPDAQGRVTLDFNRGYNPPCAFSDFATCPLPPPENRLDLAIAAGEKVYTRPGH